MGYTTAEDGLDISLQRSARSNINSIIEMLKYRYPGDWRIAQDGYLYKGDLKINDNEEIVDYLGAICEGHVTIFEKDTRIATTVKDTSGKRQVGTKASQAVIDAVLQTGGQLYRAC